MLLISHALSVKIGSRIAEVLDVRMHLDLRPGIVKPVDGIFERRMHGNGKDKRLCVFICHAVQEFNHSILPFWKFLHPFNRFLPAIKVLL